MFFDYHNRTTHFSCMFVWWVNSWENLIHGLRRSSIGGRKIYIHPKPVILVRWSTCLVSQGRLSRDLPWSNCLLSVNGSVRESILQIYKPLNRTLVNHTHNMAAVNWTPHSFIRRKKTTNMSNNVFEIWYYRFLGDQVKQEKDEVSWCIRIND